jgi:hypothetical protein
VDTVLLASKEKSLVTLRCGSGMEMTPLLPGAAKCLRQGGGSLQSTATAPNESVVNLHALILRKTTDPVIAEKMMLDTINKCACTEQLYGMRLGLVGLLFGMEM